MVWYKKERFYEVTSGDVLPPKKKKMKDVEHFDGDFENLIYKEPVLDDCYLKLNSLSEEQLDFIADWCYRDKSIAFDVDYDSYFIFCEEDNDWHFSDVVGNTLVTFNDLFIEKKN